MEIKREEQYTLSGLSRTELDILVKACDHAFRHHLAADWDDVKTDCLFSLWRQMENALFATPEKNHEKKKSGGTSA